MLYACAFVIVMANAHQRAHHHAVCLCVTMRARVQDVLPFTFSLCICHRNASSPLPSLQPAASSAMTSGKLAPHCAVCARWWCARWRPGSLHPTRARARRRLLGVRPGRFIELLLNLACHMHASKIAQTSRQDHR